MCDGSSEACHYGTDGHKTNTGATKEDLQAVAHGGQALAQFKRELAQLAQASNFKTRAAKEGALDFAQLHAG